VPLVEGSGDWVGLLDFFRTLRNTRRRYTTVRRGRLVSLGNGVFGNGNRSSGRQSILAAFWRRTRFAACFLSAKDPHRASRPPACSRRAGGKWAAREAGRLPEKTTRGGR